MKTATQPTLQVGAKVTTTRRIIAGKRTSDHGVILRLEDGGYCVVQWDSDGVATSVLMMSLRPAPQEKRTIKQIAGELADTIYWEHVTYDRQARLGDLLIEFAEEIQRRSIEP